MADLGEVLGSLLVSIVHARRRADEETAAVAEYYKEHPLLEGMSLPRIRIPEISIDMPITIDSLDGGEKAEVNNPALITKHLARELQLAKRDDNVATSPTFDRIFTTSLQQQLAKIQKTERETGSGASREAVARAVDTALHTAIKKDTQTFSPDVKKDLQSRMRLKASEVGLKKEARPSSVAATITSADVKEKSSPGSSVRLKLVLREEGLEWSKAEGADGTIEHTLQPE